MSDDASAAAMAKMRRFITDLQQDGKYEIIEELVHPDFTDHTPMPGVSPKYDAVKTVMSHLHQTVADRKVEVLSMVSDGKTVATHKIIRGTQVGDLPGKPATNGPIEIRIMDFLQLVDGKFHDHWATTTGLQDVKA